MSVMMEAECQVGFQVQEDWAMRMIWNEGVEVLGGNNHSSCRFYTLHGMDTYSVGSKSEVRS